MSEINDPQWGITVPFYIYTHDQVSISLCLNHVKTVENKGVDEVFDFANSEKDARLFCTLNLAGPM